MTFRVIVIPTSGPMRATHVSKLDLDTIRRDLFEDEAYLESVRARGFQHMHDEGNRRIISLLVDEDGLNKGLPVNERASLLYGAHVHGHMVVGLAVVVCEVQEMTEEGPDWVLQSVPEHINTGVVADAIDVSIAEPQRFRA